MNGLDLDLQLYSATYISASSSSDDLLLYSTVLMWHSFLALSLVLGRLLDFLAQLSQSRAHCKTWLTSEKCDFLIFLLGAVTVSNKPNQ
jgi:hypothetical protein